MKQIICCVFAHDITKGMKSFGSISLLKPNKKSKELLFHTISNIKKTIKTIFLVLGFDEERISKKIKEYRLQKIEPIFNYKYDTTNQGYAFKLAINTILSKYSDYDGILFINHNNLIKKLPSFPKKKSWILVDKKSCKKRYQIGCFIKDNILHHMFYDLGDIVWAEVVYFSFEDLKKIQTNINEYYDNMFMFEIINKTIENENILFHTVQLDKASDLIRINGIKDKAKIK
jgi:choline kinase